MRGTLAGVSLVMILGYGECLAAPACLTVPADAPQPVVTACETPEAYTFEVVGQRTSYEKEWYRAKLRATLNGWLANAGVTPPADATVDLWLAVPEANPAATQARAVVTWKGGGFVAFLTLAPDGWALTNRTVGVLDSGQTYPQNFGHHAGTVLVKGRAGGDAAALSQLLAAHGASTTESLPGGWAACAVAVTAERTIADAVKADARAATLVDKVELDSMLEWIATRGRAFGFALRESDARTAQASRE